MCVKETEFVVKSYPKKEKKKKTQAQILSLMISYK